MTAKNGWLIHRKYYINRKKVIKRIIENAKNIQAILSILGIMLDKSSQCFNHHAREHEDEEQAIAGLLR